MISYINRPSSYIFWSDKSTGPVDELSFVRYIIPPRQVSNQIKNLVNCFEYFDFGFRLFTDANLYFSCFYRR